MIEFVVFLLWSYFHFEVNEMVPLQSRKKKKGDLIWSSLFPPSPLSSNFCVYFSRNIAFVPAISQWNKGQQPFISVFPTLRQQNLCSSVAVHVLCSLESLLDYHIVHYTWCVCVCLFIYIYIAHSVYSIALN